MRSSKGQWGYRWASIAQGVFLFISAVVAYVMKAKPEEWGKKLGALGPLLELMLRTVQEHSWWLTPLLLLLVAILKWIKAWIGDPAKWKELQRVVDDLRSDVYGPRIGDYHHHHRVTLYQYRRRWLCWRPGSWWLLPYVRSGHTSKSNVRRFRVDHKNPGCRNGLAGRAWESEGAIHVELLPELGQKCSDDEWCQYAENTNISLKDLRKKHSSSRSYWAVKVLSKGAPWGVLVLDSVSETLSQKKAEVAFKQHARVLSLLLS